MPARSPPIITLLAPAAIALVMSPEYLIPPSAISGIRERSATLEHSFSAVSCGTPAPATILVVQIEPGPTPTLTALTPAAIRSFVASAVATLPAIMSISLKCFLRFLTVSITAFECPWAVSTTRTSTPALERAYARSIASSPTPSAAPAHNLPSLSLHACGYFFLFSISFIVIKPMRLKSLSTMGSFSILCSCKTFWAARRLVPIEAVTSPFFVITSETFFCGFVSNLRSLLVRIPTSFFPFVIGTPEILYCLIMASALEIFSSGGSVIGDNIMPLSDFLTLSTSAACAEGDKAR